MAKSQRKPQPDFDVTDFLPGPESGMESTLASLLRLKAGDPQSATGAAPLVATPIGVEPPAAPVPAGDRPLGVTPTGEADVGASPFYDDSPPLLPAPIGVTPMGEIGVAEVLAEVRAGSPPVRRRGKIVRAERVEDGHSATQDSVYWYLWRSGREVNGSRSRFVQAGYGQMQAALGIDRSNIQDAIAELQKKLSIRVLQPSTVSSPTVYEVFCCADILQRRREQGMVWVRRFGARRADFVYEEEL